MKIKVYIFEDNDHLRNSLCSLFQWNQEFEVLIAKPDPSDILKELDNSIPDVILMDIDMPNMDGISALQLLRQHHISIPVIMLTVFDDNENIYKAICAGANGYLLKNDMENIATAIRDVLNGGAPMSGSVARKVLASFSKQLPTSSKIIESLTERENSILINLVKGMSYKMIADQLEISIDTVRTHIKKIYRKLEVNSAAEAIYKVNNNFLSIFI